MKRVTKSKSKHARNYATKVLNYLQKELRENYKFNFRLVGSAVWNTIIEDNEGFWDLDYQIILTPNSKEYKRNSLSNPTKIKEDFFNCLNNKYKDKKTYRVENSTTAITLIDLSQNYSIDFVIIKLYPENNQIIRRNNQRNSSINNYTWNTLPKLNNAYSLIKDFSSFEKQDLIDNYILPRKFKEKSKSDNDPSKKSSCELFIEEVNNYENRRRNH